MIISKFFKYINTNRITETFVLHPKYYHFDKPQSAQENHILFLNLFYKFLSRKNIYFDAKYIY